MENSNKRSQIISKCNKNSMIIILKYNFQNEILLF